MTVNDSSFIKEKIKFDKKRVRLPTLTEVGWDDETACNYNLIIYFYLGFWSLRGVFLFRQTLFLDKR